MFICEVKYILNQMFTMPLSIGNVSHIVPHKHLVCWDLVTQTTDGTVDVIGSAVVNVETKRHLGCFAPCCFLQAL